MWLRCPSCASPSSAINARVNTPCLSRILSSSPINVRVNKRWHNRRGRPQTAFRKARLDAHAMLFQVAAMRDTAPQPLAKAANQSAPGAKVALILAAEVLIARSGIEGVSLREIASQAGQRNHHAVQYHFGSRDTLVQAIFDYRMDQMEATRGTMLASAEAAGTLADLRTIAEIIYRPQIELIDEFGDYSYAGFLSAYLLRYRGNRFGQFGERVAPNLARTLGLLRSCLGVLPEPVAQRRLVTASFMFLNILVIHTRDDSDDGGCLDDAVGDTLGQIVAALSAPFSSNQNQS